MGLLGAFLASPRLVHLLLSDASVDPWMRASKAHRGGRNPIHCFRGQQVTLPAITADMQAWLRVYLAFLESAISVIIGREQGLPM
jgi:hypothetical protein